MPNNKTTNPISYNIAVGKCFNSIAEGCKEFGLTPVKRGWITLAGARFENASHPDPDLKDVTLWFPSTKNNYWNNTPNKGVIVETPKDITKNQNQVNKYLNHYELRITFLKDKSKYCFVGAFELDPVETKKKNQCVWKRVLPAFSSDLHEIKNYLSKRCGATIINKTK